MALVKRNTHEIDIRQYELSSISQAIRSVPLEDLAIRFEHNRRYDIGSMCYVSRFSAVRKQSRPVDAESLISYRPQKIQDWIIAIVSEFYINSRGMTCYANTINFAKFADWNDQNGFEHFLATPENYHKAYQKYTAMLMEKIDLGTILPFTGNRNQAGAFDSATLFFPNDNFNFRSDVPLISNSKPTGNPTKPPTEKELGAYISVCDYLFNGITDFLLEFKSFPARLELGIEQPWLMIGELPFATTSILETSIKSKEYIYWDYELGRLRALEEACNYSIRPSCFVAHGHREQEELLGEANADPRHLKRMRLAKIAHDAFLAMFFANTGLNDAPVRAIPWDENYEVGSSKNIGFKTIKFRGHDRVVEVEIQSTFLKKFLQFVRLRAFICGADDSEFLFIGMKVHGEMIITQLRANELFNFNQRLTHYYDKDFNGLGVQELRAYRAHYWLQKGKSTEQTAQAMGNTPAITRKHYSVADEATAVGEIVPMLNRLMQLLDDYKGEDMPAGACDKPGHPEEEIAVPKGYEPDCKKLEGCIYCQHFRLHPNEEDIRKLLSMRFVIKQRITKCSNAEHFLAVHQPAVDHIDLLLNALKSERPTSVELIARVSLEITENFQLTEYWERQYSRMINLGIA
ncbi:hypothetical protein [Pseudomonas syringae group sp. 243L2]|uniref:hypothetical protein n=1 Tax=Pseudomonas syringae group sp. 243L2 TaxID=3079593 RepID=UPI002908231D|nr:hypothetical protein [Pseudomonas syringae group sp. 243L2]MDU8627540.1 hypothetical protein [Pseudomonas syringae group sp. 243L2]